MGIDLKAGGRVKKSGRKTVVSPDSAHKSLGKLYAFLSRRTDSKFNAVIARRLKFSRRNRGPISLSRLIDHMRGKHERIGVLVGTVTNDTRVYEVPQGLRICALKFTEKARARIQKAGGQCLTFDQLALLAPKGNNCVLLRPPTKARTTERYFGAPGLPRSHAREYKP